MYDEQWRSNVLVCEERFIVLGNRIGLSNASGWKGNDIVIVFNKQINNIEKLYYNCAYTNKNQFLI